jgi:hypothetical protein
MALEWTHLKKTRINRESSTRLESTRSTKTWDTKEDLEELKRLENDRTKWKNFTSALCSERSNRR